MENNSKHLGVEGERLAKNHLLQLGHTILEANWRYGKYEIDLISKVGATIVFTEVKARSTNAFGEPEMWVNKKKQKFMIVAANRYITERNLPLEARFDIISILQINNRATVKHLEDAFYPSLH